MPLLENVDHSKRSTTLLVGRSGAGKTPAGISWPKPMKVIDLDGRIRAVSACPWVDVKDVDYSYIPSRVNKGTVYDLINQEFEVIDILCRTNQNNFQTLFIDSLTWEAADLLIDAMGLTHGSGSKGESKGRTLGSLDMSGPEDFKFQLTGMINTLAWLKTLPIPHIVASAHIIPRWKPDPNNKYGDKIEEGERVEGTDKIGEKIPSIFDNVYRLENESTENNKKFTFQAWTDLARTVYPIPIGKHDFTGKNFYQNLQQWIPKKEVQPNS
jgi:hypothetical protein